MTKILIFKNKNFITGFEISGHSGYQDEGSDIVCSAISTASQMAVVGINEVLKLDAFVEISNGYLKLKLKNYQNESAQTVLKSMQITLQEIAKNYKNYVKMEVKKDVY